MRGFSTIFLLTFTLIFSSISFSHAGKADITKSMVTKVYSEMESALNNKSAYVDLIQTLHRQVKSDAQIKVTINNPALRESAGQVSVNLSKEDYINNFVHGTAHILNYHVDIQSESFHYDPATHTAQSKEKMIETGVLLDPRTFDPNTGKNFISMTNCTTTFEKDNGDIVVSNKVCKTNVSFAEDI